MIRFSWLKTLLFWSKKWVIMYTVNRDYDPPFWTRLQSLPRSNWPSPGLSKPESHDFAITTPTFRSDISLQLVICPRLCSTTWTFTREKRVIMVESWPESSRRSISRANLQGYLLSIVLISLQLASIFDHIHADWLIKVELWNLIKTGKSV